MKNQIPALVTLAVCGFSLNSFSNSRLIPTAGDFSFPASGRPLQFEVFSHTSNSPDTPLQLISVTQPSRGSVRMNQDGTLTYTPDPTKLYRVYQIDLAPGGGQPDGESDWDEPIGSLGGDFFGFGSYASTLNPLNMAKVEDGYIYDVARGKLSWVTPTYDMQQPNKDAYVDNVSDDARFVSFASSATNMLPQSMNTNGNKQVYVFDRMNQSLTLVSVDLAGIPARNGAAWGTLSSDGTVISFTSTDSNIVSTNTYGHRQTYLRDLITGVTEIVSVNSQGVAGMDGDSEPGNQPSGFNQIGGRHLARSDDGRFVAYSDSASNLALGLTPGAGYANVLVHDFNTGNNVVASVDQNGIPGKNTSTEPIISPDGTKLSFFSIAQLTSDASGHTWQVYQRNLSTSQTTRVLSGIDSSNNRDVELNKGVNWYSQTQGFRYFAYQTNSTNVLPGQSNTDSAYHCYFEDMTANQVIQLDVNSDGTPMASAANPVAPSWQGGTLPPGCQSVAIAADGNSALISEQLVGSSLVNSFIITKTDQFTYTVANNQGETATGTVTIREPLIGNPVMGLKK